MTPDIIDLQRSNQVSGWNRVLSTAGESTDEPTRQDRIEAATAFRRMHGFDTSERLVKRLLDNPPSNSSVKNFSVALTDAEIAEYDHLLRVQRARHIIDEYVDGVPTYAGSYMSWSRGGLIYVGFTDDPAPKLVELRRRFPFPAKLRGFRAERSLLQLKTLHAQISTAREAGTLGFDATTVGINEERNVVTVGTPEPTPAVEQAVRARFGDGITLQQRDPVPSARRRIEGGDRFYVGDSLTGCTLNVGGFRRSAGRKYHYQYSAGHCAPGFLTRGYKAGYDLPAYRFLGSGRFGRIQGVYHPQRGETGDSDSMAIFLLPQSGRTSRIEVEGRSGKERHYRVKGRLDGVRTGDMVCQYGASRGVVQCGEVRDTNEEVVQDDATLRPVVEIRFSEDCAVEGGDSGGPVFDRIGSRGVLVGGIIQSRDRDVECGEDPDFPGLPTVDAAGRVGYVSPLGIALSRFDHQLRVAR